MKYPRIDFCESEYYEPDIGISMAELSDHCNMSTNSIHINNKEQLIKAFELCTEDPFNSYVADDISLADYKYILEAYKHADINDVIKNLTLVYTIEQRAYDLPERNTKLVLKKIFNDKSGYGDFYQRFKILNDFTTITRRPDQFKEMISKVLSATEEKILFKDDSVYEAEKKAKRITHLKKELVNYEQAVVSNTKQVENLKRLLKELGE